LAYQRRDYQHLLIVADIGDKQIIQAIKKQLPRKKLFFCFNLHLLEEMIDNCKIDLIITANQEGILSNFDILKLSRKKAIDIPVMYIAYKRDAAYIRNEILSRYDGYLMVSQILKLRNYLDIMWVNYMAKKAIEHHEQILASIKAKMQDNPYFKKKQQVLKTKIVA